MLPLSLLEKVIGRSNRKIRIEFERLQKEPIVLLENKELHATIAQNQPLFFIT
jgi:hypothetical protein